jgi:hypothetical protein
MNAPADKFCGQHQGFASRIGGVVVKDSKGRPRKWICASCAANRKGRK